MREAEARRKPTRSEPAQRRPDGVALQGPQTEKLAQLSAQLNAPSPKPQPAGGQNSLPHRLKHGIEALSGMSMDAVKVHYNSSRPAQLNALAHAQGTDIHLAPGQEAHLPHEAWHVVQQAQGRVRPTLQTKSGTPVNDETALEHEADVMGARAARMAVPATPAIPGAGPAASHRLPVQRRVIRFWEDGKDKFNPRDYLEALNWMEVEAGGETLARLHGESVVNWKNVQELHGYQAGNEEAAEIERFIGHGDADKIFGLSPQQVGQALLPKMKPDFDYLIYFYACFTSPAKLAKIAAELTGTGTEMMGTPNLATITAEAATPAIHSEKISKHGMEEVMRSTEALSHGGYGLGYMHDVIQNSDKGKNIARHLLLDIRGKLKGIEDITKLNAIELGPLAALEFDIKEAPMVGNSLLQLAHGYTERKALRAGQFSREGSADVPLPTVESEFDARLHAACNRLATPLLRGLNDLITNGKFREFMKYSVTISKALSLQIDFSKYYQDFVKVYVDAVSGTHKEAWGKFHETTHQGGLAYGTTKTKKADIKQEAIKERIWDVKKRRALRLQVNQAGEVKAK